MVWDIIKKAQQVGQTFGNKVQDLSEQAVKAAEWAKEASNEIATRVQDVAHDSVNKVNEAWNSDEAVMLRKKMQENAEALCDKAVEEAAKAAEWAKDTSNDIATRVQETAQECMNRKEVLMLRQMQQESFDKISEAWNSEQAVKLRGTSKKALLVISGVQAVQARKNSINTREEADALKNEIERTNDAMREELNESLEQFGRFRIEALRTTVGKFMRCLEIMNQRSKSKEYEFLAMIDIPISEIKEMESIDMKASDALKTLAVGGGFALIGLSGTPAIVTSIVSKVCLAGTGVAIKSLSGAAATNAVLATLGGGTIAAGGGGVAVGAVVLSSIAATASVGVAVVAIGTLASRFYSRKETEAEIYFAEIKEWAAKVEAGWVVISNIKKRIEELHDVTQRLLQRSEELMLKLETIAPTFDSDDVEQVKIFQQCAIAAKAMSELAQTAILDEEGNINESVSIVTKKTESLMSDKL